MKKFKFSSRVLAFVLAFVMIASLFPLSALAVNQFDIVTTDKYVGTGIDNSTLNKDDAINWPIKVYDHLADGMLFEFAQNQGKTLNSSSRGSVSDDTYGGQYVLGQPMPSGAHNAYTTSYYVTDYTNDDAYTTNAYTTQYNTNKRGIRYSRTAVPAVNYQNPRYLRLKINTSAYSGSNRNFYVSNFRNDNGANLAYSTIRYMVMVYRSSGMATTTQNDYFGTSMAPMSFLVNPVTNSTTSYESDSWLRYNVSNWTNSSEWTYRVFDLQSMGFNANYTNGLSITPNFTSTSAYLDISHVAYFSSNAAATTYGEQCLAFNNEPGEYIQGTTWNGANNTGFGMLHPSNGAQWTNTVAGGSPSTATGYGYESTGYYTHRIGYWISNSTNATASNNNRKTGKDSAGRFNGTGSVQGENGIYYINATGYASDAGTETYDMSKLNFGGYNLLTEGIKGVWTAGLLQSTLGKNGTPQYKQETVEYIADLLSKTLVIPQYAGSDPSIGYANYNFVAGVKNRAQFGYSIVDGKEVANDLAQGLRNCLGIYFTKGNSKGSTPTMGTYADTLAKADALTSGKTFITIAGEGHIKTCMDAAYYLLHNTFVADSYNQLQDDFTYLTLSSAKLDNGEQAYIFDGGFSNGAEIEDVISGKITQQQYKDRTQSAVEYSGYNTNGNGTISLQTVNEKDYFYYSANEASITTKYPFLPVVDAEGAYAGQTDSYYFAEDGKRSFTLDNDTYYGRNYGYTMVSNGEFVYQENENLYFEFEGDDDVYLFLNGELVLDLGGGHSVASCRFNVNDYVQWAKKVLADPTSYTDAQVARANALNLEDGEIASFDFYYMERHGYGANMRILTNMHITDPALRVQKQAYQGGNEIDYGGIVDGATPIAYKFTATNGGNTKLYNITFDDADIGVSLTPENGLYVKNDNDGDENNDINGYIVTDARLGKLEAQDLTATVKGYKDVGTGGDYEYDYATDSYNKVESGTGKYQYVVADVTFADNEALKRFLTTLESNATDNTTVDDEQTRRGSGLWVDATLEISGIYYTMTDEQVEAGSFNNTVYVTATNKVDRDAPGCETKRSDDNHRVYITAIPSYYQWEDNELFIAEDRVFEDATKEAGNENSLLNEYIDFFTSVNNKAEAEGVTPTSCIYTAFCDKNGVKYPDYTTAYEHVKADKDVNENWGFVTNYDTTGIHEFYLLMYKNGSVFNETVTGDIETMEEGQYAVVRVLIIVADTEDATYVLDYGLKTENLDTNGELFKNDDLLGTLSGTQAKLMGVSNTGGKYMKVSDGTSDYNRIDFTPMSLDEHNDIYVNGKDGKADGFYTFNMAIPETGKEITYNEFSGMYSLTDSGTTLVHADVPYTWENLYLYYWYDNGRDNIWPGTLMNKTSHGNFNLAIPGNVPHIIISNGSNQSVDIDINPGEEVWVELDGTLNSEDKLIANVEYKSADGILHAKVPEGWGDVYMYYWDVFNNTNAAWPGEKIETVDADGYYTVTIPGDITDIIINNGDEKVTDTRKQTVNQKLSAGKESWITVLDQPTEESKGQNPEYYDATITTTQDNVLMHASVPSNWEKAYLYYWHSNGSSTGLTWPGPEMIKDDTTGLYSLEVPADTEHVIISDGNFRQTENIDVAAGIETWITVNALTSNINVEASVPSDWGEVRFYYFNNDNGKGVAEGWPGSKGTQIGPTDYISKAPAYATHVIITNANGNRQTENLALNAAGNNKFVVGEDNSVNAGETKIRISVPSWWGDTVKLYYWNGDTNCGWPGIDVTNKDADGYYTATIPSYAVNAIVNTGSGTQTADLSITPLATNTIVIDESNNATVEVTGQAPALVAPATKTSATVSYGMDAETEGFSFTPIDFMDYEYSIWLALTLHDKKVTPTTLGKTIDIGNEVQMLKKVTVLPASVVYYEDNFAGINYADKEDTKNVITHYASGSGSLTQSIDQNQQYGNDKTYQGSENDEMTGGSLTDVYINDTKEFANFTFTGTGFEIVGHNHAENSGTLMVQVYDASGKKLIKQIPVITEFDNGGNGGSESIVSVPLVRVNGLEFDTYKVVLSGVPIFDFGNWTDKTKEPPTKTSYLCIDGIRVYQPLQNVVPDSESSLISLGASYTVDTGTYTHITDLTDGSYVTGNNWEAGTWLGFNKAVNVDAKGQGVVTLDLGKNYTVDDIRANVFSTNDAASIGNPTYIEVYYSSSLEESFKYAGYLQLGSDADVAYWADLVLAEGLENVDARYLRIKFGPGAFQKYWVMVDEIEVYGFEKGYVADGSHDAYIDTENGATFSEIRNLIADRKVFAVKYDDTDGLTVSGGTNTWIENRNNVVPGDHNTIWTNNTVNSVNDYLLAGPNNEVYMIESTDKEKSAIAFYVTETNADVHNLQVAVRALDYSRYTNSTGSGKTYAEIEYGAVDSNGELVWKKLTTINSSSEQYFTIPYTECPYDELLDRYQVVLRVADTTPTGMASYTSLKYNGLDLLTLNETEVPDVIYGDEIGNTILDSNGNTLDTSKFVGFIDLVDQMTANTKPEQGGTGDGTDTTTPTEPVITGTDTSAMKPLYDTFTANTAVDFAIKDTSKIYVVTGSESNAPAKDVLDTAQLVQRQFAADGYDMDVVWGLAKYAEAGDILVYVNEGYFEGTANYDEAYKLEISSTDLGAGAVTTAKIYTRNSDGMLYGLNTLQKHFRAAGTNAIKGFTIVDAPDTLERTVHLDVARKYMSPEGIKNYIAQLSWQGYNSIELHMSEDGGMRMDFWGDKALAEVPNMTGNDFTWICGDNPPDWVFAQFREVNGKYLTTEEIIDICETAKEYHIDIIPSFDTPAHVGYMAELYYNTVKANTNSPIRNFTYKGTKYTLPEQINYRTYTGTSDTRYDFSVLDLSNTAVKNFAYAMYNDIAAFFAHYAGSTKFNIGADEVGLTGTDRWNYNTDFVNYVNSVNAVLKSHGYKARMYNDFLYNTNYSTITSGIDTDIEVVYWLPRTSSKTYLRSASFYADQGRTVYSGVNFWTYYVLRIAPTNSTNAKTQDARNANNRQWDFYRNREDYIYNEWNASQFGAYTDTNMGAANNYSGDKLGGAYFMIWNDFAGLNSEVEVWNGCYDEYGTNNEKTGVHSGTGDYYSMMERMWSNAIKQWNADINNTLTFANFETLRDKQGFFPGYVATDSSQAYMNGMNLPAEKEIDAAYRTYHTVTFKNYDGTVLATQEVKEGFAANYAGATPTRSADVWYTYTFSGWDKDISNITGDITVVAQFTKTATTAGTVGYLEFKSLGGSNIYMSVDGGAARPMGTEYVNPSMDFGQFVTLRAETKNDYKFIGWVNAKTGEIASNQTAFSFYTSGNDVFVAMYEVEHTDGKSLVTFRNDKTNQIIEIQYYNASDIITYPSVANYPGYEFAGWDLSDAEIKEKLVAGENFTVTTKWNAKNVYFKVVVNGGSILSSGGGGIDDQFAAYKATVVKANDATSGTRFAYWKDEKNRIVSYDAEYKFYPHKNTELTAVYVADGEAVDYKVIATVDIDATTLGDANTVFFSWDTSHTDYDIVNSGVLLVKKEHYNSSTFSVGTIDQNVLQFVPSGKRTSTGSYSITIPSVQFYDTWVAKSFVQYRDAEGVLRVAYSDLCEVTKVEA